MYKHRHLAFQENSSAEFGIQNESNVGLSLAVGERIGSLTKIYRTEA